MGLEEEKNSILLSRLFKRGFELHFYSLSLRKMVFGFSNF